MGHTLCPQAPRLATWALLALFTHPNSSLGKGGGGEVFPHPKLSLACSRGGGAMVVESWQRQPAAAGEWKK